MDEDKLSLEQQREAREKETLADINLMDDVIAGKVSDQPIDQVGEGEAAPEEAEVAGEVQDEVVAAGEPAEGEPPVEEAPAVSDEYDDAFADFVNAMARDAIGIKSAPVAEPPVAAPVAVAPAATPAAPSAPISIQIPKDFVTEEEMAEAFMSPQKMIELLGRVYVRAASDGAQASIMRLPNVVESVSAQQTVAREKAAQFYKENPELVKFKDFTQYIARTIEDAHPDYDMDKIFSETAKVAKARLPQLKTAQATASRRAATKPGFVGDQSSKSRNAPAPGKLSRLEKELSDMPDNF